MFPLLPFPTPREVILFALVLSRVAGIFAALPVFGGRTLPMRIKVVVTVMITLTCYPALNITPPEMPTDGFTLGLLAGREIMIGLTLSFITKIIFSAVEFSGQIIGVQMGFTMSSIIDPSLGSQTQIMSVMQTLLATLLFLSMNIHHLFIRTIVDSFRIIPLGAWHLNGEIINFLTMKTADIMILGVRLAAPVMVALLLTSITLGIMARAFPQMNIFMVSMPLNIGIGFIVLGLTLTMFFHVLEVSFGSVKGQIETMFHLMAKGG
ncbi:flagellar biosynthetic protein FliR [Pelotalea chapellei]|uniref:Flagellar biosynthetic protein FliR n=1 Tax=Pelotalea chapellei TaxID=44671 RepID=A0ABS5U8D9_9BACT|nr:flagellar biosynthetic protein FliR [Pelotalea chapellei]MBT1071936.1 flagellar biosynthetic protein FliR [Pelotalea chapellei]